MHSTPRHYLRTALALLALASLLAPGALAAKKRGEAASTLDEGRLEKSYFSPDAEFRETDDIDYLWTTPGFNLEGKTIYFADWPEPKFLGEDANDRDLSDQRLADDIASDMPRTLERGFSRAFKDRITIGDGKGDIKVEGRIVDCSTGSVGAKVFVGFGAGSGSTTLDIRFVDATSGQVMAGMHHRSVSGTTWSTTDSKLVEWMDDMVYGLAKVGLEKLYAKGDRASE